MSDQHQSDGTEADHSYFSVQAAWGVTKHFGGLAATDRLAQLCNVGPGSYVLEVGCGVGVSSCHLLEKHGVRLVGVDLNEQMVERSRKRAVRHGVQDRAEFRVADAQHLPFADARFDAVLCESVNAFVPDKRQAIDEYARVARPGGWVGMNEGTWITESPPDELVEYMTRAMDGAHFLKADEWRALLVGAGLGDIFVETHKISMLQQWKDERQGLDAQDYLDRLRAFGIFFSMLLRDPSFRRYARELMPSVTVARAMFTHFNYGTYVGRKPDQLQ